MGVEVCRRLGLVRKVNTAENDPTGSPLPALSSTKMTMGTNGEGETENAAASAAATDGDDTLISRVKTHTQAEAACHTESRGGFQGEVVSCDSVQVFKGLDVGSGKVRASECGIQSFGGEILRRKQMSDTSGAKKHCVSSYHFPVLSSSVYSLTCVIDARSSRFFAYVTCR